MKRSSHQVWRCLRSSWPEDHHNSRQDTVAATHRGQPSTVATRDLGRRASDALRGAPLLLWSGQRNNKSKIGKIEKNNAK